MIIEILWTAVSLIFTLLILLIGYARWNFGKLEKLGIPVVKPHFIFGSEPDAHLVVGQYRDYERYKELGPIFGVYEGRTPRIFICDPEMIRLVLVKDFEYFYDRSFIEMGHDLYNQLLDFLPGEKWKTVRSFLTPLFTTSRLKQSTKMIKDLSEEYIKDLDKSFTGSRTKFNMKSFLTTVVVDLTGKTFLAVELPDRKDPNNFLVQLTKSVLMDDMESSFFFTLINVFPFITQLFDYGQTDGCNKFIKMIDGIIEDRRKSGAHLNDFIDIMIGVLDKTSTPEYKKLGITDITIKAQAAEMFVAGYDSITTTLNRLTYSLTQDPEMQEKLLKEIDQVTKKYNGDITYDALEELPYLTACLKEATRLSPAFPRIERQCTKTWSHKDLTIEKGMSVIVPSWATNRNPEIFPDPEAFNPERFLEENNMQDINQFAYTSFGFGPRNCIGMRLAFVLMKVIMCGLLKDFKFEGRPDTKATLKKGMAMMTRYYPIEVDLVRRN